MSTWRVVTVALLVAVLAGTGVQGLQSQVVTSALFIPDEAHSTANAHVPGEILIKFHPGYGPDGTFLRDHGMISGKAVLADFAYGQEVQGLVETMGLDRLYLIPFMDQSTDIPLRALDLAMDSRVARAEPNYIFRIQSSTPLVPDDPLFPQQWALHNPSPYSGAVTGNPYFAHIDAPTAWGWDGGRTGLPFAVAIIDTGIDYTHPDLASNMWTDPATGAHGYDFVNNDDDPMDDHGHGTHMAGIVGAKGNNGIGIAGVNWNARLGALKACSEAGACTVAHVVQAVLFAVDRDFTVINMSFGSHITQSFISQNLPAMSMVEALAVAHEFGALVVASAGNSGPGVYPVGGTMNNDANPFYPASYPMPNMVAVTDTDRWDNRGGNFGILSVDLGAPGVSVWSTELGAGYRQRSGSSVATAVVTGALANYWSYNQGLAIEDEHLEIKERLLDRTENIPSLTGTTVSGGRLNLCQLFTACNTPSPPVPNL